LSLAFFAVVLVAFLGLAFAGGDFFVVVVLAFGVALGGIVLGARRDLRVGMAIIAFMVFPLRRRCRNAWTVIPSSAAHKVAGLVTLPFLTSV